METKESMESLGTNAKQEMVSFAERIETEADKLWEKFHLLPKEDLDHKILSALRRLSVSANDVITAIAF